MHAGFDKLSQRLCKKTSLPDYLCVIPNLPCTEPDLAAVSRFRVQGSGIGDQLYSFGLCSAF